MVGLLQTFDLSHRTCFKRCGRVLTNLWLVAHLLPAPLSPWDTPRIIYLRQTRSLRDSSRAVPRHLGHRYVQPAAPEPTSLAFDPRPRLPLPLRLPSSNHVSVSGVHPPHYNALSLVLLAWFASCKLGAKSCGVGGFRDDPDTLLGSPGDPPFPPPCGGTPWCHAGARITKCQTRLHRRAQSSPLLPIPQTRSNRGGNNRGKGEEITAGGNREKEGRKRKRDWCSCLSGTTRRW